MKVILKSSGKSLSLTQNDYIAGGGEGKVYGKGSIAFKIYHDTSKMIPLGKIQQLSKLTPSNVLAPRDIITNNRGTPIGFTMKLIQDRTFLTWLFDKGYKQQNNVDNKIISNYVEEDELRLTIPSKNAWKVIKNPPFDNSMPLYSDCLRVLVSNGKELVHVSMK